MEEEISNYSPSGMFRGTPCGQQQKDRLFQPSKLYKGFICVHLLRFFNACFSLELTGQRSHILDFSSHFLIQDPSFVNAEFFLMYMYMNQNMFSLIFVDLHKLEKTWQVETFSNVHPLHLSSQFSIFILFTFFKK